MATPNVPIEPPPPLPLEISAGWRLYPATDFDPGDLETLMDRILIWEPPRPDQLYVVSADVSEGLGLDRCAADVTRVGTLQEPDEQVAQFVSSRIDPVVFASVLNLLGRLYVGSDGQEAMLAIEINGPGLATQSELQRHIGYDNLFVWQYEDAADPARRMSTRVGWATTQRSRAHIITRYVKKVKTLDPVTGLPDYRINSPHTVAELRDFQTETGAIADARADPSNTNAHDDCIMDGAIGLHVVSTLQESTLESLSDARRRKSEEKSRREAEERRLNRKVDYRSMEYTADEMREQWEEPDGFPGDWRRRG